MKVGELFIELAVKGDKQSEKKLSGIKKGMGSIVTGALAATAAVLGASFALQKMTSGASKQGMGLKQFSESTGLSTKRLQQWQIALMDSDVTIEEMAGSVSGLQKKLFDLKWKGTPIGDFGNQISASLDRGKLEDTFFVLDKIVAKAKTMKPLMGKNALMAFGFSDKVAAALLANKKNISDIKSSMIFSNAEIKSTAAMGVAWTKLNKEFDLMIGREMLPWAQDALDVLGSLFKVLSKIAKLSTEVTKTFKKNEKIAKKETNQETLKRIMQRQKSFNDRFEGKTPWDVIFGGDSAVPKDQLNKLNNSGSSGKNDQTNNVINLNQTFTGNPDKDAVKDGASEGIKNAFFQLPSNTVAT